MKSNLTAFLKSRYEKKNYGGGFESWVRKKAALTSRVTACPSKASRRPPRGRHIARKRRSFIAVERSRKNGEPWFERWASEPRGSSWRGSTRPWSGGLSLLRSSETTTMPTARKKRQDPGTCLTKHSRGRYLVHATARTGKSERARGGRVRCAQNTNHSSASRGTRGSQKRECRGRASVHYQPANVQITAHLLYSARDIRLTTLGRERGRP